MRRLLKGEPSFVLWSTLRVESIMIMEAVQTDEYVFIDGFNF